MFSEGFYYVHSLYCDFSKYVDGSLSRSISFLRGDLPHIFLDFEINLVAIKVSKLVDKFGSDASPFQLLPQASTSWRLEIFVQY